MKGVTYLYDKQGEPAMVLIDLKKAGEVWEDFQDMLVAEERRHEPTIPLEEVRAQLDKKPKGRKVK